MSLRSLAAVAAIALASAAGAGPLLAPPPELAPDMQPFVQVPAGKTAITHLRIIDGAGSAPVEDATLLIDGPKIGAVLPAGAAVPAGYRVIDGMGETALPGLVGMHNHMYYIARPNIDASGHSDEPLVVPQMTFSSPRLYLATGVTTMRTTGSVEPYADLNVKKAIDAGDVGPHMDVTCALSRRAAAARSSRCTSSGPEDARRMVDFWADQGATSFKAYMHITRDELKPRSTRRTGAA